MSVLTKVLKALLAVAIVGAMVYIVLSTGGIIGG
jgi:nitrate reductase NapE component